MSSRRLADVPRSPPPPLQPIKTGNPSIYVGELRDKCQNLLKDASYRKNLPGDADEYSNPQFAQLVMEVTTPRTPSPTPPSSPPSPPSTICYDIEDMSCCTASLPDLE